MKRAILLILIYLLAQVLAALTVAPIALLCHYLSTGEVSVGQTDYLMVASMLVSFVYMVAYLWKRGYLTDDGAMYRPTTPRCIGLTLLAAAASIFLTSLITSYLSFLPDLMADNFALLQSTWVGIACITVLGPAVEELVFRRGVHVELSRRCKPIGVVLLSGLLFGISHINPAQIPGACLMGFLLAWLYLHTGSLVPGLVIHIVNNGLATWLSMAHPEWEDFTQIMSPTAIAVGVVVSIAMLVAAVRQIGKLQLLK